MRWLFDKLICTFFCHAIQKWPALFVWKKMQWLCAKLLTGNVDTFLMEKTCEFVICSLTMYYINCVMHGQKDAASDLIKTNESVIAWQHLAHFWESIRNGSILQNDSAHQLWHLTFANSCSIFFTWALDSDSRKKSNWQLKQAHPIVSAPFII